MKRLALLFMVLVLVVPTMVAAQSTTTNTAFQVANLSATDPAQIVVTFYDLAGAEIYVLTDSINAGSSKTYIQANMEANLGTTFNGSVVIESDQPVAAIVNQNTSNGSPATAGYNGSYTGFSQGSNTFQIPIVLSAFYGYHTEISVQNAGDAAANVTVNYVSASCVDDTKSNLAPGAAVRFNNETSCAGGGQVNTSATISASGPVVAIVNQIGVNANLEQTYNGFAPADGGPTLYAPIALRAYYGFNSAMQVQNISSGPMDIIATYSDGVTKTVTNVAVGASATFLQANEAHADKWTGSAKITNSTGGAMVGIVNQQGAKSAASYNMYTGGAQTWILPSLLHKYYGFTSAFQIQNVGTGPVDITVTYDDGTTKSATGIAAGATTNFLQDNEVEHVNNWAGSARVTATGDIVVVVNQDVLTAGSIDYQYSYNAVPLD
jgi:hypothetical protein